MQIKINELMATTGVQFGTSGVRGLVDDMTDQVCWAYVTAFLQYLKAQNIIQTGDVVGIAGDLRSSTPRIMNAVATAVLDQGLTPINYGMIPSPAIALYGLLKAMPTIMVTGSHIPDDRNGIKFNKPDGEILKPDEIAICEQVVDIPAGKFTEEGELLTGNVLADAVADANEHYINRFINFFPSQCLQGQHIGLYEHSSVSRDCFKAILTKLGANVISLGRTDQFISVDTEAIRPEDVSLAKQWSEQYKFDCIISTDGDGDRPLISDEHGNWLRGDIAGILCAQYLNVDVVVTPVSSNSAVDKSKIFNQVIRTKIGSPYVIEAMARASLTSESVVGYEANGGFLQHSILSFKGKTLSPLATRDAVIVPLAIIMLALQQQLSIAELVKTLPPRFTYSDRLKAFPTQLSHQRLSKINSGNTESDLANVNAQFGFAGIAINIDSTDGIRITFDNDDVVHLRPSGNAPELRCYTEAASEKRARELNSQCMTVLAGWRQ